MSLTTEFLIPKMPAPEWKSEWRKDFEAYMGRRTVTPKIVVPVLRKSRPHTEKRCPDCRGAVHIDSPYELCWKCRRKPKGIVKEKKVPIARKSCTLCPKLLNQNNSHGLCKRHQAQAYKRRVPTQRCEVCNKPVRNHSQIPFCIEHGKTLRNRLYKQKMREAA